MGELPALSIPQPARWTFSLQTLSSRFGDAGTAHGGWRLLLLRAGKSWHGR